MQSSNEISIPHKIFALANDIDQKNNKSIKEELIKLINELINNDFSSLVQLLYRIDIDENKLKQNLKQHEGSDSASLIAEMIIKRQLQKIESGNKFYENKKQPGEESW
ncbi:MAG TPA: hypothetical protein VGP55_08540 [Chitinophagaceae bacterium]|nr:hypothetical protein [Chitinophagaceae bacterium]